MMRIVLLFLIAVSFGLIVYSQTVDINSTFNEQNTNYCTGGACRIDKMKQNTFFQNDMSHSELEYNTLDKPNDSHNRGGLNNNSDFTYDFNCQFGSCLPDPSGSYKP